MKPVIALLGLVLWSNTLLAGTTQVGSAGGNNLSLPSNLNTEARCVVQLNQEIRIDDSKVICAGLNQEQLSNFISMYHSEVPYDMAFSYAKQLTSESTTRLLTIGKAGIPYDVAFTMAKNLNDEGVSCLLNLYQKHEMAWDDSYELCTNTKFPHEAHRSVIIKGS